MVDTDACLRWAIVSTGKMAADLVSAVATFPKHHKVVAVAAREDISRAKQFADRFSIPRHYGSYKDLAQDAEADVVYVATSLDHAAVSMMMLNQGKHVLCELPGAEHLKDLEDIVKLAHNKGLFYMEAHAMVTYPAFRSFDKKLAGNKIGDVEQIRIDASSDVMAFDIPGLRIGVLRTLGHSGIFLALKIYGCMPESIITSGKVDDKGMDIDNTLLMSFKNNNMAVVTSSFCSTGSRDIRVYGNLGSMTCKLWRSYEITVNGETQNFPMPVNTNTFNFDGQQGLIYMADHVREMITQGNTESDLVPHAVGLDVMRVVEEARTKMGL